MELQWPLIIFTTLLAWSCGVFATQGVLALKGEGKEIQLTGSITLCHTLIAAGLVDEYRIWTVPYVQGRGRRLFPDGHREHLVLREHLAFAAGVTYTRWTVTKD